MMKIHEPPTTDFDDSPYPYDTPKFRCIFVKRCIIGLVEINYNHLATLPKKVVGKISSKFSLPIKSN